MPQNHTVRKSVNKKQSRREKILIAATIFLLVLVLVLFIVSLLQYGRGLLKGDKVCTTSQCIKTSAQILEFLNPESDPCVDFEEFVCGAGRFKQPIMEQIKLTTEQRIKSLIIHDETSSPNSQHKFYRNCISPDKVSENHFWDLVDENLGGWPIVKGRFWDERKFDSWLNSMVVSRNLGFKYQHFLSFVVQMDKLRISPPDLAKVPMEVIEETVLKMDASLSLEQVRSELERIGDFAQELQSFIEESRVEKIKSLTLKQLKETFQNIDWQSLILNLTKIHLVENSTIEFNSESYLINLMNLLHRTPKKVQSNLVIANIVLDLCNYLGSCGKSLEEKQRLCLQESRVYFPHLTESAYIHQYVDKKELSHVEEIVEDLKHQMVKVVENCTSNRVPKKMSDAIKEIRLQIGGLKNDSYPTENVFDILTTFNRQKEEKYFAQLYNRDVNSYGVSNSLVVLSASLLQGFLYNFDQPNFVNYATIGDKIAEALAQVFPNIPGGCIGHNLAYHAYQLWTSHHGMEVLKLPGLEHYTPNQLFWISSSIVKCGDPTYKHFPSSDFQCPQSVLN